MISQQVIFLSCSRRTSQSWRLLHLIVVLSLLLDICGLRPGKPSVGKFASMRGLLLTGLPGVGKSTACRKIADQLRERGWCVEGFLTEEIREHRKRVGFDVVQLGEGSEAPRVPLARLATEDSSGPRVSKYVVKVKEFEALALPILDRIASVRPGDKTVCIIDEIGKMELFSAAFVEKVRLLLARRPVPMLFTIALRGGGFIAEAKRVPGMELVEITEATRDAAPAELLAKLIDASGAAERPPSSASATEDTSRSGRWRRRTEADSTASPLQNVVPKASTDSGGPGRVVVWLRSELRVEDNPLLQKAAKLSQQHSAALLAVFCLDPLVYAAGVCTNFKSPKIGTIRRKFTEESLADLAASLEKCGSKLLVCENAPEQALPLLAGRGDLVLVTRQSCPEERTAEARVKSALERSGAALEFVDTGGVTTIFGASDLEAAGVKGGDLFPEDFRVFYDAVKSRVRQTCRNGLGEASRLPSVSSDAASWPEELRLCALPQAPSSTQDRGEGAASPPFIGGESAALERLRVWLRNGGLQGYKSTFRRLSGDYSSRLSAHLALGCISPRRLCSEAVRAVPSGPHVEHFLYELCWRDFFIHAGRRWGPQLFLAGGPLQVKRNWRRDSAVEARWRNGETGVPLVDAAMRELRSTGYLGNLARQFTAAFLIEELDIDWRVGADWFESTLVDYDPHSNWGQWTRSAGVAPTNEAKRQRVGGTRYFDLALSLPQNEAETYVRTWVPELRSLEGRELLAPWMAKSGVPAPYPAEPLCSANLRAYFERGGPPPKGSGKSGGRGGKSGGRGQSGRGWRPRSKSGGRD